MKLEELEIGQTYTRCDDGDYYVLYKEKVFAVVMYYSHNHHMAHLQFLTQADLDEPWNQELHKEEDWNLGDYFDEIEHIEDYSMKINC